MVLGFVGLIGSRIDWLIWLHNWLVYLVPGLVSLPGSRIGGLSSLRVDWLTYFDDWLVYVAPRLVVLPNSRIGYLVPGLVGSIICGWLTLF